MTFYVENETEFKFPFNIEEISTSIIEYILEAEECPYEVEVSLLISDNERIQEINKLHRGIDKATDVLSFPNVDYEEPSDFSLIEDLLAQADYFHPDTGELILGDIMVSYEKVLEQAKSYGHSQLREFSFLLAHSMLHLLGYDHMEQEEMELMERKQEEILKNYIPYFTDFTTLINVAKGIVLDKQMPLSMLIPPLFGLSNDSARYAVLSGPSFAKEVVQEKPTACVLACEDQANAEQLRSLFSSSFFRCYSSTDVLGLELGGAVKNIIAIATGISDGLDFGHNARAALITRGLAEISRLGTTMGATHATFMGLSGLGDLMLTCTGDLSRNRQVGLRLGRGERLHDIIANMNGVAEGVPTTYAVKGMGISLGVDMPIVCTVDAVLREEISPHEGLRILMERTLKMEV